MKLSNLLVRRPWLADLFESDIKRVNSNSTSAIKTQSDTVDLRSFDGDDSNRWRPSIEAGAWVFTTTTTTTADGK